jgi:hypothetical protein
MTSTSCAGQDDAQQRRHPVVEIGMPDKTRPQANAHIGGN